MPVLSVLEPVSPATVSPVSTSSSRIPVAVSSVPIPVAVPLVLVPILLITLLIPSALVPEVLVQYLSVLVSDPLPAPPRGQNAPARASLMNMCFSPGCQQREDDAQWS